MLTHYLLTLYRSLSRHRLYAAINVLGLAVGIAVFLVLFLDVRFETSFERWIPNADQIYVVRSSGAGADAALGGAYYTMGGLLEQLRADYPQLIGTRLGDAKGTVRDGGKIMPETFEQVDPSFFKVFDLPLVEGDKASLLQSPDNLVISQTKAKQYFAGADPLGRRITLVVDGDVHVYRVAGVLKDPPKSTDLTLNFLLPLKPPTREENPWWSHWGSASIPTYLRFETADQAQALNSQLDSFTDRHGLHDMGRDAHKLMRLRVHPLTFMHMHSGRDLSDKDAATVAALGVVGLLTLLLAAVNYVNLATARAALRAREVAVRKVMGATGTALIVQFMAEAFCTAAMGALLGVALCELALPLVNAAGGLSLKLDYVQDPALLLAILLTVAVIGLGAGAYPALVLSRFQPAAVLASAKTPGGGRAGARVREALVALQFAVAITFTIATGVIVSQTHYVRRADLGFRRQGLIVVDSFDGAEVTAAERSSLLAAWRALPGVISATAGDIAPGFQDTANYNDYRVPGRLGDITEISDVEFSPGFFQTYGARLLAGRLPDLAHTSDFILPESPSAPGQPKPPAPTRHVVLNLTAVRALGFETPERAIGRRLMQDGRPRVVIGVVDDLRFLSPHQPVRPTVYYGDLRDYASAGAGMRYAGDPRRIADDIEKTWRTIAPTAPFHGRTIEQQLDQYYAKDDHQGHLFTIAAVLAVLIGCVGLYGLASFNTARRVKEIGIRKTLGASTGDILKLLVGQFLRPVVIANLFAWPLAWWAMSNYLAGFDQRIALTPVYFLAATALTLLIAVATVAGQAYAVARAEPAKALRHE
jgi:putative ABC transport system permease protein